MYFKKKAVLLPKLKPMAEKNEIKERKSRSYDKLKSSDLIPHFLSNLFIQTSGCRLFNARM